MEAEATGRCIAGDRAVRVSRPWPPRPADESFPGRNGREDGLVGDHLDFVTRELREGEINRDLGLGVVGPVVSAGGEFDDGVARGVERSPRKSSERRYERSAKGSQRAAPCED